MYLCAILKKIKYKITNKHLFCTIYLFDIDLHIKILLAYFRLLTFQNRKTSTKHFNTLNMKQRTNYTTPVSTSIQIPVETELIASSQSSTTLNDFSDTGNNSMFGGSTPTNNVESTRTFSLTDSPSSSDNDLFK